MKLYNYIAFLGVFYMIISCESINTIELDRHDITASHEDQEIIVSSSAGITGVCYYYNETDSGPQKYIEEGGYSYIAGDWFLFRVYGEERTKLLICLDENLSGKTRRLKIGVDRNAGSDTLKIVQEAKP